MKQILRTRSNNSSCSRIRILVPLLFALTGMIFLMAGIERGEVSVVLRKAINICLECIGIG